uniref:Kinesin motor domain-containing protein n=1 Tax=Kalanchoe fedtschenkoi TaxID=63787 RepID=A0A7N0TDF2_KALFE
MLRDFKSRRNAGKVPEEAENLPVSGKDSVVGNAAADGARAPLVAIQEPQISTTATIEVEGSKKDKTSSKGKGRGGDNVMRTPEKYGGFSVRNRFGWGQKSEAGSGIESGSLLNVTPRSMRSIGRTNSGVEGNGMQVTPNKSVNKPPTARKVDVNGRIGTFAALYRGLPAAPAQHSGVNPVEVPHFDLKEDPSFWMDHNVQVLIRVRPLNEMEKRIQGYSRCLKQESAQTITWTGPPETRFTFDHVACETVDQETLFRMAGLPMVENCLSGYNSCMFAYGQTGSGKTYTMLGEIDELEINPSPHRGMTPRVFEFLFGRIRAEEETRKEEKLKYSCKCSFLEIYNEQITDLLDPSATNLHLREDMKKGVYVDNLSEFEVQSVTDILMLLSQGASNRKVAATNMNRESSRSHSVFTCVIESQWEKDATTNLRFARLNLVDLAGSERQKASGAEGERLKEAASINKSLSTLGHVIMVLLEVAHGKPKHVPYRDSKLTFLLQDSLGGNSKTMIIANVSSASCCATETLNTLKFAQRAKLIQNNAVVNEDSSGDVSALQQQIRILKEELVALKRNNVLRSLSFGKDTMEEEMPSLNTCKEEEMQNATNLLIDTETKLKSLEMMLAGSLRREQMAESSIKQLEAEIQQLNRLVRQREEDARSSKMMLRFREDKIHRMESLVNNVLPVDSYLVQENKALTEEIQLVTAKLDRNPEVTRFALENIRLLDQIRRYQDFYEEGEKEMLLTELSELRKELLQHLDGNAVQPCSPQLMTPPKDGVRNTYGRVSINSELNHTASELEECRTNLRACLEENAKLSREISALQNQLSDLIDPRDLITLEVCSTTPNWSNSDSEFSVNKTEDLLIGQLELDILKIFLQEAILYGTEMEDKALNFMSNLELAQENLSSITRKYIDTEHELQNSKSVIEALESQQILLINEIDALKNSNNTTLELLNMKEVEILDLKEQVSGHEYSRALSVSRNYENEDLLLSTKLTKMQESLAKAKSLNAWYQKDHAKQTSSSEEMENIRRQAEVETAEVIVCLQEELSILQWQIKEQSSLDSKHQEKLKLLEDESKVLQENLLVMTQERNMLDEQLKQKDGEIKNLREEMENIRRQAEVETAEVIVCLQRRIEEQSSSDSKNQEMIKLLEDESKVLQENLLVMTQERNMLDEQLKQKDEEIKNLCEEMVNQGQAEVETAEVIACSQEELSILQRWVEETNSLDLKHQETIKLMEDESKVLQENLLAITKDCNMLGEQLKHKDGEIKNMRDEWKLLICEIEHVLCNANESLTDASADTGKTWISEQVGQMAKIISEKEILLEELRKSLEEANIQISNLDCMLRSLKGAALVINDSHQKEFSKKENEILILTSQLSEKSHSMGKLCSQSKSYIRKLSVCATAAFVIVNHFSEANTNLLDKIKQKDTELCVLEESNKTNSARAASQAVAVVEAEKEIFSLHEQLNDAKARCNQLEKELVNEKEQACFMAQKLQEFEAIDLSKTKEKLTELQTGVSTMMSSIGMRESADNLHSLICGSEHTKTLNCQPAEGLDTNIAMHSFNLPCSSKIKAVDSVSTPHRPSGKDWTMSLLRKEIESALESLEAIRVEMAKLRHEKEKVLLSERNSQKSIKCLKDQVIALHTTMKNFDEQTGLKMTTVGEKLQKVEILVEDANTCWSQTKELFETEVFDAKMTAEQKTAEAYCIFDRFEESQGTIREADCMINTLIVANKAMKAEVEALINERTVLLLEIQSLQSTNDRHNHLIQVLEKQLEKDLTDTKSAILELEDTVVQVQNHIEDDFQSMVGDLSGLKCHLILAKKIMHSSLEDIWSELIVKDCIVSVLHLCHIGLLLETALGLNVENGLIQHGLSEQHSIIADLREQNSKSRQDLNMCRIVEEKLLTDLRNSFERAARKEDETGEFDRKLITFEQRILDLQAQEEIMLQRSNSMEYELADLKREMDNSNSSVFTVLLEHDKLLKDEQECINSQAEFFLVDMLSKDLESLVLGSKLKELALEAGDLEIEKTRCLAASEKFKEELFLHRVDGHLKDLIIEDSIDELSILTREGEKSEKDRNDLSAMLKDVANANDALKKELEGVIEWKEALQTQVIVLKSEHDVCSQKLKEKEAAIELSSIDITLRQQNQKLEEEVGLLKVSACEIKNQLEMKDAQVNHLEGENEAFKTELNRLHAEKCAIFEDLKQKRSDYDTFFSKSTSLDEEIQRLQKKVASQESSIAGLQSNMTIKEAELNELHQYQSVLVNELSLKGKDSLLLSEREDTLLEDISLLKGELDSWKKCSHEYLSKLSSNIMKSSEKIESAVEVSGVINNKLSQDIVSVTEKLVEEMTNSNEMASHFMKEFVCVEDYASTLLSANESLRFEILVKDELMKGMVFDLTLLQESASDNLNFKEDFEVLLASFEDLKEELANKSAANDDLISNCKNQEAQLQVKTAIISTLQMRHEEEQVKLQMLSRENAELVLQVENVLEQQCSIEEELVKKRTIIDGLESELLKMSSTLMEAYDNIDSTQDKLNEVISERDHLHSELLVLEEKLDMAEAQVQETEAIATEAKQMAETERFYVEEKEEEIRLLERSIEELETTIDVLENKVEMVRGEAERQRVQREELEVELHSLKNQIANVESSNADIRRHLNEKETDLEETLQRFQDLEKDISNKDAEIAQLKIHISELNVHAEAQAVEYKQKFKALESMAEKVKLEGSAGPGTGSLSNKLERNASKPRGGSGSPFKCIGLGLVQQMKSEKEEDLTDARRRIEELEALAASRQKEIFMLNSRLATAESMTHDVIRELLGVKLDMTQYASLLDADHKITEKALLYNVEPHLRDTEVAKLKQQLDEFIEERKGWLDEIDRKQAELMTAQVSLEKLHQTNRLLKAENDTLKMENTSNKKQLIDLEKEVNKLSVSGQQNLQQRIHHHAKVKEENNFLRSQNEDLSLKLRRAENILSRVREELSAYRASVGKSCYFDFDDNERLHEKLKETEEEKLQLAQKLLALCTSILKVAGITRPASDITIPAAEEALGHLKNKITSLERDVEDLKLKNKITMEKARLSELMPQLSPLSPISEDKSRTPGRVSNGPFLSTLDR